MARLFLFLSTCFLAISATAETLYYVAPESDYGITTRETSEKTLPSGSPDLVVTENGLTCNIFFIDIRNNNNRGFDSPANGANARARFEDALRYIANVINESGTLDIVVTASETDGGGALAFAGTFYSTLAAFQPGLTLQRLSTGVKPFATNEEITCTVDFGFNWNFTTSPPTNSQVDFQSVITHELTHGLGFASVSDSTGASQIAAGAYTNFDALLHRGTPNKVLFSGSPPSFKGSVSDLVSTDLFFFGTQANSLYAQGVRPGIFAPNPFQPGSSISHWDTGNIVGGAVMEHAIIIGDERRTYSPVDIGALIDIGYTNAADPGATPANLTVNPNTTVNFGNVSVGIPTTQNFTVTNTGGTSVNGTASVSAPFSIVTGANFTLGPGASTTVQVRFAPAAAGIATTNLSIGGDPDGTILVGLTGTGVIASAGNLTVSPSTTVNYGNVQLGANASQNFLVQNTGGTAITGTAVAVAPFSVTSNANFTVNPGASVTVAVRYTPSALGVANGNVKFTGDPDGNITVNLTGTGVNSPGNLITTPDISPGIDMGLVPTDSTSEFSFTVTNNGGQAITGNASTSGAPFSISAGASYTLSAGQSATVKVLFTPTDTIDFSGVLTLTGDPDGAIATDLIGTGAKASTAACALEKGRSNTWSLADGIIVACCAAGLMFSARRGARVRG